MSSPRESFLARVRQAVAAGNRPGDNAPPPPRGRVGYQGAGTDPAARFRDECIAAGGHAYLVPDRAAAVEKVLVLVRESSARRVLLGRGAFLDSLNLANELRTAGVEVITTDNQSPQTCRDPFFAADLGITGVDYLIAETGSLALFARPGEPRSFSLLPPVHIAVAHRSQLLPDLFDLFDKQDRDSLPSCLSLITGPSKTGDIELRLVTGVHGPGELHVVLVGT
jgi:L-lactate dehydrogenase complex protein LldG